MHKDGHTDAVASGAAASPSARPRVVLIGPVPPFGGGISHHDAMLIEALEPLAELLVVSFTRQHPRLLWFGKPDIDADAKPMDKPYVRYVIDSLNPWTWRACAKLVRGFDPDIVIIPWSTVIWGPCYYYLAGALRRQGIHVRFFCHRVVDHQKAGWKGALTVPVLRRADSYAVHARALEQQLKALFPAAQVLVYPHPIYGQFPAPARALPRAAALELLFYGYVRPYKGVDVLIEAMGLIKDHDVRLTVVGEFWIDKAAVDRRIAELGIADRVELVDRYVSETETADYFSRADVVVLPYRSATSSGVAAIAYHYEKPLIVTQTGGLPEIVVENETGFVVPPESPGALADAILGLDAEKAAAMAPAIRQYAATLTWENLAKRLIASSINAGSV